MDWFLYDNGLRHERVNKFFLKTLRLAVLRRLEFDLSHLITVDGKSVFEIVVFCMKQSNFNFISGITIRIFCWF